MPRADRLSPGGVKLLQEKQLAIIATLMPDGSPQTTQCGSMSSQTGHTSLLIQL